MKTDLEKQLERDLKRHRDENPQALPSWAQTPPTKTQEKKPKKRKKKK
ncbi:MAG TPA: hypothetical protein VF627_03390 [Abditibacterium sp.]|jgi:hypothetical protein